MAEIKAVADPKPDPKVGVPRRVSGTPAPYYNLDNSVQVARVIHEQAGGSCDRAQLAALLNYKGVDNGAFLTRVTAAKLFGLVLQEGNQIRVTERGRAVVAPVLQADADAARVEAFLAVELFRKVFEEFNGQPLPLNVGLQNLLLTKYGVVPDRVAPTVNLMLDSAEQAGFFKMAGNRTRMVRPLSLGATTPASLPSTSANGGSREPPPVEVPQRHGGGGGGEPPDIPSAILGLLRGLPKEGTPLTTKRRDALVAAFTATVEYLYPDADAQT